jgi:phage tail-like protein
MKSERIQRLLPAVIARTASGQSPLAAILAAMEQMHAPTEDLLSNLDCFFDPLRAPAAFVPYLASWVDLDSLLAERADKTGAAYSLSTGLGRLRELTASAAMLSQWRGTRRGLQAYLQIATGVQGFKIEENISGPDNSPRAYHLRITVPHQAAMHSALIKQIITLEKPAYVTHELVFAEPGADEGVS